LKHSKVVNCLNVINGKKISQDVLSMCVSVISIHTR